ncbi:hypothetical protein Ddc_02914 [Ditylenchus destructor]|nr:hypothetical protein Ddc_02914 [Ditylenchus destructor]
MCCWRKSNDKTGKPGNASVNRTVTKTFTPDREAIEADLLHKARLSRRNCESCQRTAVEKSDSFTALEPTEKNAKRAPEIKRRGAIQSSTKKNKEYLTMHVEEMSDFNKTLNMDQDKEHTCISRYYDVPEDK